MKAPGEDLPVVGEHFLRHPVVNEDRPGRGPQHRLGDHAIPGMIIDPGDYLRLPAAGEEGAGGHVHLPQPHRHGVPSCGNRSACGGGTWLDKPVTDQRPVDHGAGHRAEAAAAHLKHQPLRPQRGWDRRSAQIAASSSAGICHGCARTRCERSASPGGPSSRYLRSQALTATRPPPRNRKPGFELHRAG